ncbi:MAG TPA: VanW family protein [Gaiellaceae bacterium]|jgi:vancomycin resistance protein YoaR|nr:VanW family protein [Gaiellaceae bacterium]
MKRGVVLVVVLLVAAGGAAIARALEFQGSAKPGVHVLGVDVGGQSRAQIERHLRAWSNRPVTIRAAGRSYHVRRGWLVTLDTSATATRVLDAGSWDALVFASRVDVAPVVTPAGDASNVLEEIARSNRAPVSATVSLHGTTVVTTPAETGLQLDRAALLHRLSRDSTVVEAPYTRLRPAVSDSSAGAAASHARTLLTAPVAIDYHGARLGALTPLQMARAVRFGRQLEVTLDGETLARVMRPRLGRWIVRAHNAQFVVVGGAVHVAPSHPGRDVNAQQFAAAVTAAARGDRIAHIDLGARQPDLTTAKAKALGIHQQLVSYTTQMGVSSSNRIHNVHLMADFIDGTIVKPGQVFSFNDVVGPRTAERGFLEGQEIIGSLVLPSIGGGVCQTATTLFNDAFEIGLPIIARTNHNLYLAHYPIGRDATVAWGGPDFRFKNDLKHGLLIKTSYTDSTLTFTFYGTSEHRRVVSHTGAQVNWTGPSMNYAVDPNAPRGSVKVVTGSGEKGFDVTVDRTVYDASGKQLRHDTFKSHYIPDSPTTVYGPGKTPPGPYIVLPSTY